ncbi:MAG: tRNA (adenosine(37)-N6)-threonylcarbamoyltransferase complex dimerization subunit type 1 TsaB [Acidobacteria bacterium]|nr:tRNA (adenosine(37)-N6)-threonylcarbamoyltransferase complex dimerization subunit type 1 TsaB [Acidobacteriota bacterium]
MNLLCFDTSSRDASIAVLRDEEVVLEYNFSSRAELSAMLIPSLEFLLRSLGLGVRQVDLFGVSVGPGLFTGIRVGLATLKGLDFPGGRPVVGVNALEALACKFADTRHTVVPMIDARKGETYLAAYRFDPPEAGGGMVELLAPCLLRVADAVPLLEKFPDKVFVGSGAENHGELLRRDFPGARLLYRSNFLATEIGRIALERFRLGQYVTDLQQLHPLYIRKPDAESSRERTPDDAD